MATKHLSSPFPGSKFSFQIGHFCTLPKEHCSTIIPLGSALRAHGGNCDDIPCTIFVRLLHETDDEALLLKIHKVVFVFPDHRKVTKNMVPFSHHFTATEDIDIQGTHNMPVTCTMNPMSEKRSVQPLELSDKVYSVEIDLVVPYPHNRNSHCSPERITKFLEERSDLRFIFSGYYLDENGATGGAQIPSKNFTGKGRSFAPIQRQQEVLQTKDEPLLDRNPNRRRFSTITSTQKQHISRSEGTTVITKPELFGDTSWRLSFDSRCPTNISGVEAATYYILSSPELRGFAGLEIIFSAMIAIAAAANEVKLLRRPGFRILVSVADLEFSEIKKICQQYMKFESVVERIIPHVEIKDAYSRHHNDWDCVYMNGIDIDKRNRETILYRSDVLDQNVKNPMPINKLLQKANSTEELMQLMCPFQSRFYRFSFKRLKSRGLLEFRFARSNVNFHFLSCCIQLLIRFVESSAAARTPKKFLANGVGQTIEGRERKFFEWLIRDRYLYNELQKQENEISPTTDNLLSLALLSKPQKKRMVVINPMFASPGEMRVEARRLGVRVNLPQASWSDNVDDILKKSGALPRKLIAERPPSPVTDPSLLEIERNSDGIRAPSPIQAEAERSTPQRPNRPRSSASRQSSELRGGVASEPRASTDDGMSTTGPGGRDSFMNTRQTIVKFQLFS